jgi:hypothetical protein
MIGMEHQAGHFHIKNGLYQFIWHDLFQLSEIHVLRRIFAGLLRDTPVTIKGHAELEDQTTAFRIDHNIDTALLHDH